VSAGKQRERYPGQGTAYAILWYERRADVLEARRRIGIGRSDVAALWGLSTLSSPFELWAVKTGQFAEPDEASEARMISIALAPAIDQLYRNATQRQTFGCAAGAPAIARSERWPHLFMGAPEFVVDKQRRAPGVLLHTTRYVPPGEDLPRDLQLAAQHAMAVTGLLWASIAALNSNRLAVVDLDRDEPLVEAHLARCDEFWRSVQKKVAPALDGLAVTARALQALNPTETGEVVDLGARLIASDPELRARAKRLSADEKRALGDSEAVKLVDAFEAARKKAGEARDEIRLLENRIIAAFGDASIATLPDGREYAWRTVPATAVVEHKRRSYRRLELINKRVDGGKGGAT
jgi:predicted phage-related endonuclease